MNMNPTGSGHIIPIEITPNETNPINHSEVKNNIANFKRTPDNVVEAQIEKTQSEKVDKSPNLASEVENLLGSQAKNAKTLENKEKVTTVGRTAEMATAGNKLEQIWIHVKAFLSGEASPLTKTESREAIKDIGNLLSAGSQRGVDPKSEHSQTLYRVAVEIQGFPDPNNKLSEAKAAAEKYVNDFQTTATKPEVRNHISAASQREVDPASDGDQNLYKLAKEILGFPDPDNKLSQAKTSAASFARTFEVAQASRAEGQNRADWPSAKKSATYDHATHKNNCDFVSIGREGIMVVDGPGHGHDWVVALQHPLFEELGNDFFSMSESFNSSPESKKENAAEIFKSRADGIITHYHLELRELITGINLGETVKEIKQNEKLIYNTVDNLLSERQIPSDNDIDLLITETKTGQARINSKIEKFFKKPLSEDEKNLATNFLTDMRKAVEATNNVEARGIVKEAFKNLAQFHDQKVAGDISGFLKLLPTLTDAGSGIQLNQIVYIGNDVYRYKVQGEDSISVEIPPDGGEPKWTTEIRDSAIGGGKGKPVITFEKIEPGTIIMNLTDGYGEFLTQDEIIQVIKDNPGKTAEEISAALKAKIIEIAKNPPKKFRLQASKNSADIEISRNKVRARPTKYIDGKYIALEGDELIKYQEDSHKNMEMQIQEDFGCKILDLTGGDAARFDDLGFAMMVARPRQG